MFFLSLNFLIKDFYFISLEAKIGTKQKLNFLKSLMKFIFNFLILRIENITFFFIGENITFLIGMKSEINLNFKGENNILV